MHAVTGREDVGVSPARGPCDKRRPSVCGAPVRRVEPRSFAEALKVHRQIKVLRRRKPPQQAEKEFRQDLQRSCRRAAWRGPE